MLTIIKKTRGARYNFVQTIIIIKNDYFFINKKNSALTDIILDFLDHSKKKVFCNVSLKLIFFDL